MRNFAGLAMFIAIGLTAFKPNTRRAVSGNVVEANNKSPIAGVSVILQGTGIGTQTDSMGRYHISAEAGQVLLLSFIGYRTQEVPVSNNDVINITLVAFSRSLNEVLVNAYGAKQHRDSCLYPGGIRSHWYKARGTVVNQGDKIAETETVIRGGGTKSKSIVFDSARDN